MFKRPITPTESPDFLFKFSFHSALYATRSRRSDSAFFFQVTFLTHRGHPTRKASFPALNPPKSSMPFPKTRIHKSPSHSSNRHSPSVPRAIPHPCTKPSPTTSCTASAQERPTLTRYRGEGRHGGVVRPPHPPAWLACCRAARLPPACARYWRSESTCCCCWGFEPARRAGQSVSRSNTPKLARPRPMPPRV